MCSSFSQPKHVLHTSDWHPHFNLRCHTNPVMKLLQAIQNSSQCLFHLRLQLALLGGTYITNRHQHFLSILNLSIVQQSPINTKGGIRFQYKWRIWIRYAKPACAVSPLSTLSTIASCYGVQVPNLSFYNNHEKGSAICANCGIKLWSLTASHICAAHPVVSAARALIQPLHSAT